MRTEGAPASPTAPTVASAIASGSGSPACLASSSHAESRSRGLDAFSTARHLPDASRRRTAAMIPPVPVYALTRALVFPPPEHAEDGLLAVGGDLSPERLLLAYRSGIFPWYDEGLPILWHSPDPRCVLPVDRLHVGRTLRRVVTRGTYDIRYDTAFERVIRACQKTPRPGQDGTWITDDMASAYLVLHRMGYAHSIEAWHGGELAGGLYGVSLGR